MSKQHEISSSGRLSPAVMRYLEGLLFKAFDAGVAAERANDRTEETRQRVLDLFGKED